MLNIKKTLTKVLNVFNAPFVTVSNSVTISTAPGSKSASISLTIPQGYGFLAFMDISLSYAECNLYAFGWDGANSRANINYRNNYSGTLSVTITVKAVCYKLGGGSQ